MYTTKCTSQDSFSYSSQDIPDEAEEVEFVVESDHGEEANDIESDHGEEANDIEVPEEAAEEVPPSKKALDKSPKKTPQGVSVGRSLHGEQRKQTPTATKNAPVAFTVRKEMAIYRTQQAQVRVNVMNLLQGQSISESALNQLNQDTFWHAPNMTCVPGAVPTPGSATTAGVLSETLTLAKRRKSNKRAGRLDIADQHMFRKIKLSEEKLQFIAENMDRDTSKYNDKCRQWLLCWNPSAECFTNCCNNDTHTLLAMHGNGKGDFSLKTVAGMKGCQICSKKYKRA